MKNLTTRYTSLEVTLNGLTFLVSGVYIPAEAETRDSPGYPAEFQFDLPRITVKGLPSADALTILEEFRSGLYSVPDESRRIQVKWTSGLEQLELSVLRALEEN